MRWAIRWTRDRWFLLGLAFLGLNTWAVLQRPDAPPVVPAAKTLPARRVEQPQPPPSVVEPLRLVTIHQVEYDPGRSCTLRLTFNAPPRRGMLGDFITLKRRRGGKALRYTILGDVESKGVLLQVTPATAERYRLTLRAGLASADGRHILVRDETREFNCTPSFTLNRVSPAMPAFGQGAVQLFFSSSVAMRGIEGQVTIRPPVEATFEHVSGWRESGVAARGDFEPGMVYTFTLDASLASATGKPLGEPVVRQVYMPDLPSSIRMHGSGHYLSAAGRRELRLDAVNVKTIEVTSERVHPNNLVYFAMRRAGKHQGYRWYNRDRAHEDLSERVATRRVEVSAPKNKVREVALDMDELTGASRTGAFMLHLQPDKGSAVRRLMVLTDIGLTAKRSPGGFLVWANSIRTARPLEGAAVAVYSQANQLLYEGRTDADGLARFGVEAGAPEDEPFLVTAAVEDDLGYLALEDRVALYGETRGHAWPAGELEAFLYTDRGIYRPGEEIRLRAIVRDAQLASPEPFPVALKMRAPDGRISRTITGMLGDLGTAEFAWTWPDHVPTGRHRLELQVPASEASLGAVEVAVEEFVPPRIAAEIPDVPERVRKEDGLRFELAARFLEGRPAAGRKAEGRASFAAVDFAPAGYEDYTFHDASKRFRGAVSLLGRYELDEDGRAVFETRLTKDWAPPSAIRAILYGLVRDVDGRTTAAHAGCMVDVYPRYVGLRTPVERGYVSTSEPVPIDVVVLQPDGKGDDTSRTLEVAVHRMTWATVLKKNRDGGYSYQSEQRDRLVEEAQVPVRAAKGRYLFVADAGGSYRVTVRDAESGSSSSVALHALEPGARWADWSMEKPDRVTMELDRERYAPGEEARLVLHAPFAGRALLTVETDRVVESRVLDVPAGRSEVTLRPGQAWLPAAHCSVSVVRPLQVGEEAAPHRAVGVIPISVEQLGDRLALEMEVPEEVRPRETLRLPVQVKDHQGRPAACEVVVAAVDEGICRLTNFETPDPHTLFRGRRALASQFFDLYSCLMPEFEAVANGAASASGGGAAATARKHHLNPVRARRFRPVALWSGPVLTDAEGRGTVAFELPEFTGRLRLMAVAVGRRALGHAESRVVVKRPVQAYTGLPRFLAPGDRSRLSLTLVNGQDEACSASYRVECSGPVTVHPAGGDMTLAPDSEEAVFLELEAGNEGGLARLAVVVVSGDEQFREDIELAVRPPAARTVRSGVVAIAPGSVETVNLPSGWLEGTPEYSLTLATLPVLGLGRSLDYLLRYPHGCVEQTTSASFPLLYLPDLANATRPVSMGNRDTTAYVGHGILRLLSMQQPNGGFGYWPRMREVYPWGSLYATHFLVEADKAGYPVPEDRLAAALQNLEQVLRRDAPGEGDLDFDSDRLRRAYACHVLSLAGLPHHGWLGRLAEEAPRLDTGAQANVASALALAGRRPDARAVLERVDPGAAAGAERETSGCLRSPVRDLGLLLSAWVEVDPTDARTAMLAQRLRGLERGDRWRTTQEHAVALMALGKYVRQTAGRHRPFEGQISWADANVSLAVNGEEPWRADPGTLSAGPVTAVNYGPGQAYLYWKASGVPAHGLAPEQDHRVRVRRTVFDEDGEQLLEGPVVQGRLLVVRLTVDTLGQRLDQLVVEDLLPAGLEPENVAVKTSGLVPWVSKDGRAPVRHREMRDDRALVFPAAFRGSKSVYYFVRVVSPGTYIWPPATVSCMYDPSIRSVHGAGRLKVVE